MVSPACHWEDSEVRIRATGPDSAARAFLTAILAFGLTLTAASTSDAGIACEIYVCDLDKKCSVGGSEPQDSCTAVAGEEVTYSYHVNVMGGRSIGVWDDKLGVIGTTDSVITKTTTLTETTTNRAETDYYTSDSCYCLGGIGADTVTVTVLTPTPSATPTATPTPNPSHTPTYTPTATPTFTPEPCEIWGCRLDKKCSVGGSEPQDSCTASPGEEVTYIYQVWAGGYSIGVWDDKLGDLGTTDSVITKTTTLTETTTNWATLDSGVNGCPCMDGVLTDTVTVTVPTPTPTATPNPCTLTWPTTMSATIAKGQSPTNNAKITHLVTGNIIDPGSLGSTAHRIEVCSGTLVTTSVTDTTGIPSNTAGGSLSCNSAGCTGVVTVTEKYQSISADGRDKDSITFIPK
jgi:hypothetical protein